MFSKLPLAAVAAAAAIPACSALTQQTFDYVVIGGGTSGLVIANRLTESSNVTVAVIEAGDSVYNNTNVTTVLGYGLAFGTNIDWAFETVNQTAVPSGLKQTMRAGKAIGGTSTINGMAYTRAQNSQIDNWDSLGEGWNWDSLFPYYLKSETIQVPTAAQAAVGVEYNASYHGTTGPVKVGWIDALVNVTTHELVKNVSSALDIPTPLDIAGGLMNGYYMYPSTVDTAANLRYDAARAYYWPIAARSNLKLFTNTLANRIIWSNSTNGSAVATGVSITTGSTTTIINAKKEVIVSAGSLRSPIFLEHSGIGNPTVLKAAGVDVVVDLPTVGENLQDQTNVALTASATASYSGSGDNVFYPTADQVFGSSLSSIKASVLANLTSYAERTSALSNNITKSADLLTLFKKQFDLIFDGKTPIAEILVSPSGAIVDAESWTLLPFSRGNIHISSSNTSLPATINPNYYNLEWDVISQAAVSKYIRKILATAPLAAAIDSETKPGTSVVGANATDAEWFTWMGTTYRSNFHPVGTTAMMPREMGGVVDSTLRVYGTRNVRVVDAGVLPFQVCGHLVSTLYAVAERAADIIRGAA